MSADDAGVVGNADHAVHVKRAVSDPVGPVRKAHLDTLAVSLLLACCLLWGLQQVLIKITLAEVAPMFQAWMWMLGRYPATQVSVFVFFTPLFALLFGSLWLKESVTPGLLVALATVAAGIVLMSRRRAAPAPHTSPGKRGWR